MTAKTPMLRQYFEAKAEHPGVLLAMRVGDFFEFYGEDAEIAAQALEITLTGREDGSNGRISMAGVPHHSVEKYLARLVQQGFKVALCDQLEDPKTVKGSLVRRGVTRILTPGTVLEESMLASHQNNFLVAVSWLDGAIGIAALDSSTGEFVGAQVDGEDAEARTLHETYRLRPAELLIDPRLNALAQVAASQVGCLVTPIETPHLELAARSLLSRLRTKSLDSYGCRDLPALVAAAAMCLDYAAKMGVVLDHLQGLATYSLDAFMRLDLATRRSLELTRNLSDGSRQFTLLSVLDQTVTPMGGRLLRKWIEQPLLVAEDIIARHDAVGLALRSAIVRGDLREVLRSLGDVERLVSRCVSGIATPRDLGAMRASLKALPKLEDSLHKLAEGRIQQLREQIGLHHDLHHSLAKGLVDEPPAQLRDGGVVRDGFDAELDHLRDLSKNGKAYIARLEQAERERCGISSLKVGFNSVFGYYIEVSKAHTEKVPVDYIRKQTTASAERYITADLKEHEATVLGAQEKALSLESELFARLRREVADHAGPLMQTARAIAELDALASFAEVAAYKGYVRPELSSGATLKIESGRHPVVENHQTGFVPNDTDFDDDLRLMVLTGPNMSGKSTYLRQTALIVLMAQIGSFVPAQQCRVNICDRIFARIGAKDELALGQSTFMVEMVESANILNNATADSLVILDEIGRGTSTYDGLAIAWAMAEALASIGCITLFATHYHPLNALADQVRGVANFRVSVEEIGDSIVWTHRVLRGGTDRSYGIHVARMAGVPRPVLDRAAEVLADLENTDKPIAGSTFVRTERLQLTLFEQDSPPVVEEIKNLDVNSLTPIQALKLIDDWKRQLGH